MVAAPGGPGAITLEQRPFYESLQKAADLLQASGPPKPAPQGAPDLRRAPVAPLRADGTAAGALPNAGEDLMVPSDSDLEMDDQRIARGLRRMIKQPARRRLTRKRPVIKFL